MTHQLNPLQLPKIDIFLCNKGHIIRIFVITDIGLAIESQLKFLTANMGISAMPKVERIC